MYNVLIGICTGGSVYAETVTSLIGAMDVLKEKGIGVMLSIQIGGYVAHNRNELVRRAQADGATHLMFIDADQTFPPSGIIRLLDHDKDIVGAMYNTRGNYDENGKLISTLKMADEEGNLINTGKVPAQLFKCYAVPTGFMLINMRVFDDPDMPRPFFEAGEDEKGEHYTEDVEFCKRAHAAHYDVWCSPTIHVGHIGKQIF